MGIKKEIYIIISAFFLLAVFLVLFSVYPLSKEIAQSSRELVSQINSRLLLKSQYDEAGNFKQKYESYQQNLAKIDSLFIDPQNPVDFIEFLEKTASDLGIKLQISSPAYSKEGNSAYESFQLSSSGSFSNTLKFASQLEAGQYLIKIQNLNIGSNKNMQDKKQTGQVGADISIKVLSK